MVQYNYRVQKINSGEVEDLIKADINLEYELFSGEGVLEAPRTWHGGDLIADRNHSAMSQ